MKVDFGWQIFRFIFFIFCLFLGYLLLRTYHDSGSQTVITIVFAFAWLYFWLKAFQYISYKNP
ncbi:hypothetical protein HY388_01880 [Candidatus Daviesbacteria bacterium]|nr:hypothetical protein [Candidatus Daviesbacteria bacterium]